MARSVEQTAQRCLQLNRYLFLRDGDRFALELARYLRTERIVIGEEALSELIEAARRLNPEHI